VRIILSPENCIGSGLFRKFSATEEYLGLKPSIAVFFAGDLHNSLDAVLNI
jgi:hypothetical protein